MLRSPKKNETAVHCCDPALSVVVMSGVSKRLSRSISRASHFIVVLHVASALEKGKSQISVLVMNMVGASVEKLATHPHKIFLVIPPPWTNTLAESSRAKEILIHDKGIESFHSI